MCKMKNNNDSMLPLGFRKNEKYIPSELYSQTTPRGIHKKLLTVVEFGEESG